MGMKRITLITISIIAFSLNAWSQPEAWYLQSQVNTPLPVCAMHFNSTQKGWLCGGAVTGKTLNGGATWSIQPAPLHYFFRSITFVGNDTGWCVGDFGSILKTTNGGNTWNIITSGSDLGLYSVFFIDSKTGWTVGGGGTIRKTTDGGNTWVNQPSGAGNTYLIDVQFLDSQNGFVAGPNFFILKTTDGGNTWSKKYIPGCNRMQALQFINPSLGWAAGLAGQVYKTTNGGETWSLLETGCTSNLMDIWFTDSLTGWVIGPGGTFLHTSDGGETWDPQDLPSSSGEGRIYFVDGQQGWILRTPSIFHTSTGGITPIHKTLVSSPTFSIYPNPAEEWVTLQAKCPIQSIRITDALGRSVETGHPLSLQPDGNGLNISFLKPGLYWVKIRTAEGTSVQKLVKR